MCWPVSRIMWMNGFIISMYLQCDIYNGETAISNSHTLYYKHTPSWYDLNVWKGCYVNLIQTDTILIWPSCVERDVIWTSYKQTSSWYDLHVLKGCYVNLIQRYFLDLDRKYNHFSGKQYNIRHSDVILYHKQYNIRHSDVILYHW